MPRSRNSCYARLEVSDSPVPVWLIEDTAAYRQSLVKVLNQTPGFTCAAAFGAVEDALDELAVHPAAAPQVILLDIGLPGLDGVSGLPRLRTAVPAARIIMLTSFDDHERVFRAIRSGASGYLLKTAGVLKIIEALQEVLQGGAPMSPPIARAVLTMFAQQRPPAAPAADYGLTPRETQILECLVAGRTLKEAAAALGLSPHTVDTHLRHIYEKLQVNTRQGAVAKAVGQHLVER